MYKKYGDQVGRGRWILMYPKMAPILNKYSSVLKQKRPNSKKIELKSEAVV